MPRTKVPPGSSSKRSCSSASSWRAANLSCCATSVSARPRSSRRRASSAPTPLIAGAAGRVASASVILPPLQRAVLGRRRETAAKLVGVCLLGDALAAAALDAQREPERLRARRDQLVVARHQPARLLDLVLLVADLAELDQRRAVVGLH